MVVGGFGWFWLIVGWFWLVVTGFGWFWLVACFITNDENEKYGPEKILY